MLKRSYCNIKKNYAEKRTYLIFMRGTEEVIDNNNSCQWMKKGYVKKETEALGMAAQDQSLQTRWVKRYINRTNFFNLLKNGWKC